MLSSRKIIRYTVLLMTLSLLVFSYPRVSADGVNGLLVTSFSMNGSGSSVTVAPGSTVSASLNYQVWTTQNPIETDQVIIYYSWNPVPPLTYYCAYNAQPGPSPGYSGTASFSFTAPSTPGTYSVYVAKGSSHFFCDEAATGITNYGTNGFIIGSITVSSTQAVTITSTITRPTTITSTQTVTQTVTSNLGQPKTVTTTVTSATTITSTQTTTQTVTTNAAQPITITSTRTVTMNLGNNTVTTTLTRTSTVTTIQPTTYITTSTATKTDVSTSTATSTLTQLTTLTSTTAITSIERATEPLLYTGVAGATIATAAILVVALLRRKSS